MGLNSDICVLFVSLFPSEMARNHFDDLVVISYLCICYVSLNSTISLRLPYKAKW